MPARRGLHGLHIGISDAQIDQLLDLVDRNHDGEIDYYEFAQEIFGVSAAKAAGLSLEHKARSADEKERRKREVMRAAQQRASLHPVTDALVRGQDVFEQQPTVGRKHSNMAARTALGALSTNRPAPLAGKPHQSTAEHEERAATAPEPS